MQVYWIRNGTMNSYILISIFKVDVKPLVEALTLRILRLTVFGGQRCRRLYSYLKVHRQSISYHQFL